LTHESMLDLLETQLPSYCQIEKKSIHENGITVSIERDSGEVIRFFCTDCQSARECFAMQAEGIKCCDYLLLYAREESMHTKELLCFIELKGKALHKAVDQICSTYKYVMQFSRQYMDRSQHANVTQVAAIFLHGRVPSGRSCREREKLARIFDEKHIYMKHAVQHNHEFSRFIRNIYA